MPSLRPANVVGAVGQDAQRRRAARGLVGRRRGRARRRAAARGRARRRPCRRGPRRRCAGWRPSARGSSTRSTLLSSKTNASTMCCCSIGGLAEEELPGLAVVVGEALRPQPPLRRRPPPRRTTVKPSAGSSRGPRCVAGPRVRLVVHPPDRVDHRHVAVLLEVGERALRRVDRQVGEVRAAEPLELGVEVREVAALQQRVVGEVDAGHDVLRAERDLLGLGEEVVDHAVEHQPADRPDRDDLLGDQLGRVEHVEVERVGELVVEQLDAELPLREVAAARSRPTGRAGGSRGRRR